MDTVGSRMLERWVGMLIVAAVFCGPRAAVGAEQAFLWWQGEAPAQTNFPEGDFFSVTPEMKQVLSEGEWLDAAADRYGPTLFATYQVEVPRAGTYNFWVRKFWKHGPFRWRFDAQPWRESGRDCSLFDTVYLRPNICASWVSLGRVELAQGRHRLRVENTDTVVEKPGPEKVDVPPLTEERATRELNDWCTITYPTEVAVGQTVPVTLDYRGIEEKTRLCCDLSWKKGGGSYGGVVSPGAPYPEVKGSGRHTFHLKVVNEGPSMAGVFCTIYLSKDGTWGGKSASVTSPSVPVNPDSVKPIPRGASAIAFDCFVLSEGAFFPRGKLQPGETYGRTEDGWFSFEPPPDPFDDSAVMDLRLLNHRYAGEKGYLRASGTDFVFERDGEPVKFWGPCIGSGVVLQSKSMVDHFARRMAKYGCNMVRLHGRFHGGVEGQPLAISDDYMDHFNYFVAALKRQGIYLMLNTYYDHFFTVTREMNLPGYRPGATATHFQFIHPRGHQIWRSWVKRLLDAQNPYTGLRNAGDPTIAIVQLVNEDNYFWYTFVPYNNIPGPVIRVLEKRFGDWLVERYGSLQKAREAWGKGCPEVKGDAFEDGRVGLFPSWALRSDHREGRQRYLDQARFMTEDLRDVLGGFQRYLKEDLGFRGLVNGGNWKTAMPRTLGPLDKYANAVCDVMDRHGVGWYKGPIKLARSWALNVGDVYRDLSPLRDPEGTPLTDTQYSGKTHVISEPKSPLPNRFRTDWIPLTAVYGLVQGTDAFTHFAGSIYWRQSHGRWSLDVPTHLGQFPATALIFRNGYIQEGPVVVREALKLADLYALKGAAVTEAEGLDEMTRANIPEGRRVEVERIGKVDPLAYYVGKVVREIAREPGPSRIMDLRPFIDRGRKLIRSANGELVWDWDTGLLTINAPCAQGVVGFLREAGPRKTDLMGVSVDNEYGAVLLVSMDGEPLSRSRRMLLQVMSEDRNYGYRTTSVSTKDTDGDTVKALRITDVGRPPIMVRQMEGTVTIERPDAAELEVVALNVSGYRRHKLPGGSAGRLQIKLLPDCFYYVLRR